MKDLQNATQFVLILGSNTPGIFIQLTQVILSACERVVALKFSA